MKPWTLFCGALLEKNSLSRVTSTTGSLARRGSGSLVMQKSGSLSCKLAKQVSKQCVGVVPKSITMHSHGPYLSSANTYYYFDGSTGGSWPTHDPCGRNQANQVKGVVNPHGNIFVKWKISQAPDENWEGTKIKSLNANKLSKEL